MENDIRGAELADKLLAAVDIDLSAPIWQESLNRTVKDLPYKRSLYHGEAIHAALLVGDDVKCSKIVQKLLKSRGNPNSEAIHESPDRATKKTKRVQAIHMAAFAGFANVTQVLVEAQADVNVQEVTEGIGDPTCGNTALHTAAWYQQNMVANMLLKHKAAADLMSSNGFTPLHHAARLANAHLVENILLASDNVHRLVNMRCRGQSPRPAIVMACEAGSVDCFNHLFACALGPRESKLGNQIISRSKSEDTLSEEEWDKCTEIALEKHPHLLAYMLCHPAALIKLKPHAMDAIRQIIMRRGPFWAHALDRLVRAPKTAVEDEAGWNVSCPYEAQNMVTFWQLDFQNWWLGLASLQHRLRTLNVSKDVIRFCGDETEQRRKQMKKDLLHRLEVQDGTRLSDCFCCLRRSGKNEDTVRRGTFSAGSAKHARLTPVELKVIPLAPDSLVEDRTIEAIAATKNDQVLKTVFVAAVLAHAWRDVVFWYYLNVAWAFLQVVFICWATLSLGESKIPSQVILIFLGLGVVKKALEEAWQLLKATGFLVVRYSCEAYCLGDKAADRCVNHCNYFLSCSNLADWLGILVQIAGLFNVCYYQDDELCRGIIASYFSVVWIRALYCLRGVEHYDFNQKLLPILAAMQNTVAFFCVLFITFCASVHSYYIIGRGRMPQTWHRAFQIMFRLAFLGDFDMHELEYVDTRYSKSAVEGVMEPVDPDPSEDHVIVHTCFYIVAFAITIIEMNLFIGVLSNNFDRQRELGLVHAARARANAILDLRRSIWSDIIRMFSCSEIPYKDDEWLFVISEQSECEDVDGASLGGSLDSNRRQEAADVNQKDQTLGFEDCWNPEPNGQECAHEHSGDHRSAVLPSQILE